MFLSTTCFSPICYKLIINNYLSIIVYFSYVFNILNLNTTFLFTAKGVHQTQKAFSSETVWFIRATKAKIVGSIYGWRHIVRGCYQLYLRVLMPRTSGKAFKSSHPSTDESSSSKAQVFWIIKFYFTILEWVLCLL